MSQSERTVARSAFVSEYGACLRRYLAEPDESELSAAYELGRRALASGHGVSDIVSAHGAAIGANELSADGGGGANDFLLECLAPLEMAYRGFREAIESLRALNKQLERARAEQHEAILATTSDGFFVFDSAGRLLEVNDAYCRISGYTRVELLGLTIHQLEATENQAATAANMRRCVQTGFERLETRHRAKDGRLLDLEIGVSYWREQDRFLVFARDIAERKLAEQALAHMRGLLDRTQELNKIGGWEYDVASGRILWTDEVYRIHGLDHNSYDPNGLAQDIAAYDRESTPIIDAAFRRAVADGEPYDLELGLIRGDGERIWVRTIGEPVFEDGRVVHVSGNIADITERRRAEQEILALNTELEQRVIERTAELRATNEELETFAYCVSHDLRAPLRAMDGFSQILLKRYADQLDERGRDCLSRIRGGAQRMGSMIDDLLALSRVSRAELLHEHVDLSALAREVAAELERAEPERIVQFTIPDGMTARGDPGLLRIVLENLLGNAWKYTSKCQTAHIQLAQREHDGTTAFSVRDDGAGFDMAYADQLFKPFQRLHHADEFPGIGIGLASVQRIITRHGGSIWAQSELDRGATFTFTLR